ncbi:MAG: ribonuclease HII [Bacilli bacterium]
MKKNIDIDYYAQGYRVIAGCDEAGRGPIAGPVVAAAVILPPNFVDARIHDSKQLTPGLRETLFTLIQTNALAYAITVIDVATITKINILEASRLAMEKSLAKLKVTYDVVLSDAMKLPKQTVPVFPLIHGDALSQTIAASSILAKVTRDRLMDELHVRFPHFAFAEHKGYPTPKHLALLKQHGPIQDVHRPTFGPVKKILQASVSLLPR